MNGYKERHTYDIHSTKFPENNIYRFNFIPQFNLRSRKLPLLLSPIFGLILHTDFNHFFYVSIVLIWEKLMMMLLCINLSRIDDDDDYVVVV